MLILILWEVVAEQWDSKWKVTDKKTYIRYNKICYLSTWSFNEFLDNIIPNNSHPVHDPTSLRQILRKAGAE